jgi:hypothetical protein
MGWSHFLVVKVFLQEFVLFIEDGPIIEPFFGANAKNRSILLGTRALHRVSA